jgi:hypothetical protein
VKKHKPWFEGCSKLADQRKEAKLQWVHDPSEINGDNLNNARCEASMCLMSPVNLITNLNPVYNPSRDTMLVS